MRFVLFFERLNFKLFSSFRFLMKMKKMLPIPFSSPFLLLFAFVTNVLTFSKLSVKFFFCAFFFCFEEGVCFFSAKEKCSKTKS